MLGISLLVLLSRSYQFDIFSCSIMASSNTFEIPSLVELICMDPRIEKVLARTRTAIVREKVQKAHCQIFVLCPGPRAIVGGLIWTH